LLKPSVSREGCFSHARTDNRGSNGFLGDRHTYLKTKAPMKLTTDCWEVDDSTSGGNADFVLPDVRSHARFRAGHVPGSVAAACGNFRGRVEKIPSGYPSSVVPSRIAMTHSAQRFARLNSAGP
jgi:hypothetical protein